MKLLSYLWSLFHKQQPKRRHTRRFRVVPKGTRLVRDSRSCMLTFHRFGTQQIVHTLMWRPMDRISTGTTHLVGVLPNGDRFLSPPIITLDCPAGYAECVGTHYVLSPGAGSVLTFEEGVFLAESLTH